jgi:hypothetical protein
VRDSTPFNHLRVKASHNSYAHADAGVSIASQLSFDAKRWWLGGCRGLELDLNQDEKSSRWSVSHGGGYEEKEDHQLSRYLRELAEWSSQNPRHDSVVLTLDIKKGDMRGGALAADLDGYITEILPRTSIFTPGQLMKGFFDLGRGAAFNGWPPALALRGRFVLCISGNDDGLKADYAGTDPVDRLCFADMDSSLLAWRSWKLSPDRIVHNFPTPDLESDTVERRQTIYPKALGDLRRMGRLTRIYWVNTSRQWDLARSLGFNIIATDSILETWAWVAQTSPLGLI